jgi:aspartate aminotransferase
VVLNSPCNPSGIVYSGAELKALCEVAVAKGLYIISDEIYEKILYDGAEHVSPGSLSPEIFEHTITVNGFSKAFSMTGWRLGYVAAPDFLTKAMSAFQSHATSGPNTFAQYGALAALAGSDSELKQMVKAFAERRSYLLGRLEAIRGVSCVKPMGAFYVLPNISRFGLSPTVFAERFLSEQKVAVIPGESFSASEHVRFSYACSMDNIREGMDRLQKFVAGL